MKATRRRNTGIDPLALVLTEFETRGILLESDSALPSVVGILAGKPLKGSWWGHPKGKLIFSVLRRFVNRPEVLVTKLVLGKITFIHRRFWQPFLSIATSREDWQLEGLSREARRLLAAVERANEVMTDEVGWPARGKTIGDAAGELERRLLVYAEEIHTSKGLHAKRLRSWDNWASSKKVGIKHIEVAEAKVALEDIVGRLGRNRGLDCALPWENPKRRPRRLPLDGNGSSRKPADD
ncbi:MAG: hypothetical protein LYZ66_04015 [Nitrososphaerales archaeon]|nr:hypothetical protein [Nitrososphaerales archaeon]